MDLWRLLEEYADLTIPPLLSVISYVVYKRSASSLDAVLSATPYPPEVEIGTDSGYYAGKYVAIQGQATAGPDGPLVSQEGHKGVLYMQTLIRHFSRWSDFWWEWRAHSQSLGSVFRAVPFHVTDADGKAIVKVPELTEAPPQVELSNVGRTFQYPSKSIAQHAVEFLDEDKQLGIESVEAMLPIGAPVTVIGQLASNPTSDVIPVIRLPADKKFPFIMSRQPLYAIVASKTATRRMLWYIFCISLSVCGFLVGRRAWRWYWRYVANKRARRMREQFKKRKREEQRARNLHIAEFPDVNETDEDLSMPGAFPKLLGAWWRDESTDEPIPESELCVVCLEARREVVLLDCGHYFLCMKCARTVSKCPVCRSRIVSRIRAYG